MLIFDIHGFLTYTCFASFAEGKCLVYNKFWSFFIEKQAILERRLPVRFPDQMVVSYLTELKSYFWGFFDYENSSKINQVFGRIFDNNWFLYKFDPSIYIVTEV